MNREEEKTYRHTADKDKAFIQNLLYGLGLLALGLIGWFALRNWWQAPDKATKVATTATKAVGTPPERTIPTETTNQNA